MKKLILPALCAILVGCSKSPSAQLQGSWRMAAVLDGTESVTTDHNPENDRWIAFASNGTFETDGEPYGRNTGKWILTSEENATTLFLDSDAGAHDDSYWTLQFSGDTMIWKGLRTDFAKRFTLKHVRTPNP